MKPYESETLGVLVDKSKAEGYSENSQVPHRQYESLEPSNATMSKLIGHYESLLVVCEKLKAQVDDCRDALLQESKKTRAYIKNLEDALKRAREEFDILFNKHYRGAQ